MMSDVGFGTGSKSKAGVKVGVKEKEAVKVSPKEREKFEVEWRVLLHNDEVHTFDYVSRKLAEVRAFACLGVGLGRRCRIGIEAGWMMALVGLYTSTLLSPSPD